MTHDFDVMVVLDEMSQDHNTVFVVMLKKMLTVNICAQYCVQCFPYELQVSSGAWITTVIQFC